MTDSPPPAGPSSCQGVTVRLRNLTRVFGRRVVLDSLSLDLEPGEFVALLGTSGSGKSTLLRALSGLDMVQHVGSLSTGTVGMAFQEPRLLPWLRVWRNVVVGLEGSCGPRLEGDGRDAALALLAEVGLRERADAWPLTLSGGEAQRVSLARALAREPQVLLLDEPFGSLDALTRISMHRLIRRLHAAHHQTILLVTHDVDEAILLADRVLVLADGRIATDHPVQPTRAGTDPTAIHQDLRQQLLREVGVAETTFP